MGVNFLIMNVAMVTSHLMTGMYIPIFPLNFFMFILFLGEFSCFLPHNGNDIAETLFPTVCNLSFIFLYRQILTNVGYLIGTVCG